MMNQYKAFLFDLDGVLIDSEREYTRIWETIEKRFPTGVPDFARKIKGTTLDSILGTYFPQPEVRKQVEEMLYRLEGEMVYTFCEGAPTLLSQLRDAGKLLALVTSSNDRKMQHLYRDLPEIKEFFSVIIDESQVTRSKPDPQGYLLAADRLRVPTGECVVVEDSLQGVRAGKAAGAYVIGVAGTLPADTLRADADLVVYSIGEVCDLIA